MNTQLSTKEIESLLSICWMASTADGTRIDSERAEIKRITSTLTADEIRHDLLYTDVVAGLVTLEQCTAELKAPVLREQAFEMAAAVCFADKDISRKERGFLDDLRAALSLEAGVAEAIERNVKVIVAPVAAAPAPVPVASGSPQFPFPAGSQPQFPTAPVPGFKPLPTAPNAPSTSSFPTLGGMAAAGGAAAGGLFGTRPAGSPLFTPVNAPKPPTGAELDEAIRKAAILAGALEQSPDPMCSVGVSPVQKRLVARMGKLLGRELDRTQVASIIAATGIINEVPNVAPAAEVAGGYLGKLFGGLLKKAPEAAPVKPKLAFAQTYALGQLAKRHVATGLTWSAAEMKEIYRNLLAEAMPLQGAASGEIQQRLSSLNPRQLGDLVEAV